MAAEGIVHWDDCPRRRADMGPMGAEWTDLGVGAGATRSGLRRVRIDPGKRATPAHGHAVEEELVYVLGGAGPELAGRRDLRDRARRLHRPPAALAAAHAARRRRRPRRADHGPRRARRGGLPAARQRCLDRRHLDDGRRGRAPVGAGGRRRRPPAPRRAEPAPADTSSTCGIVEVQARAVGDTDRLRRDLGSAAGSVTCGLQHVMVAPGRIGCPPHVHSAEEEAFVVLAGDGVCLLGAEEHPLRPGSVIVRPPGHGRGPRHPRRRRRHHLPRLRRPHSRRHVLLPALQQDQLRLRQPDRAHREARLLGRRGAVAARTGGGRRAIACDRPPRRPRGPVLTTRRAAPWRRRRRRRRWRRSRRRRSRRRRPG